MPQPI